VGIFSNFFKSQPLPEDEIQESENVMRKLKEQRQEDTSQWVASIQDPNSMMPATYTRVKIPPKPTIEDVDKREEADDFVYTPPEEAMYTPFEDDDTLGLARAKNSSSTDWVSKIFQEFERQGNTFNASAQGTNLVLSIHPPQYTEEVVAGSVYGQDTKVRFFKGYVSTSFWGMMLHGHHDKIDVYIVPAEAILQLSLSSIEQSGFSPFMTIDSAINNGELEWHVGGTTILYAAIPNLAKQLLGDLIKIASGKLQEEELFADKAGGLKLDQGAVQNLSQVLRIIPDGASSPGAGAPASTVATAVKPVQADPMAGFMSFAAADRLVDAVSNDLTALARLANSGAPSQGDASDQQLKDLATAMRTLLGQVSTFSAQYKPKQG
jgi:hypothetical protein